VADKTPLLLRKTQKFAEYSGFVEQYGQSMIKYNGEIIIKGCELGWTKEATS